MHTRIEDSIKNAKRGSNPGTSTILWVVKIFLFSGTLVCCFIIFELVLVGLVRCLGWQGSDFQLGLLSRMSIFGCLVHVCSSGLLMRWRIVSLGGSLA
jgi:hypothetical protein